MLQFRQVLHLQIHQCTYQSKTRLCQLKFCSTLILRTRAHLQSFDIFNCLTNKDNCWKNYYRALQPIFRWLKLVVLSLSESSSKINHLKYFSSSTEGAHGNPCWGGPFGPQPGSSTDQSAPDLINLDFLDLCQFFPQYLLFSLLFHRHYPDIGSVLSSVYTLYTSTSKKLRKSCRINAHCFGRHCWFKQGGLIVYLKKALEKLSW